jgi:hypothetical protein
MKMSCDEDVTDEEIERALEPIAVASTEAINRCMFRLRNQFPDLASGLGGVGGFEIENAGRHYKLHYECWNKTRVSFDGKNTHITAAGLPRPIGLYTIERLMDDLIAHGYRAEDVIRNAVGFDVYVSNDISHTLSHHKPLASDIFDGTVTDYKGVSTHVKAHQSPALFPAGRWLGETLKLANKFTVSYLNTEYGRDVALPNRYLRRSEKNGLGEILIDTENGPQVLMSCEGDVNE